VATVGIATRQHSAECSNLFVIARNIGEGLAWFGDLLRDEDGAMGLQGDFFA